MSEVKDIFLVVGALMGILIFTTLMTLAAFSPIILIVWMILKYMS